MRSKWTAQVVYLSHNINLFRFQPDIGVHGNILTTAVRWRNNNTMALNQIVQISSFMAKRICW